MDSEASLSSDIKSDGESDRELVPDMESIKGSQGSDRVPLVDPGRGSVDPIKGSKPDGHQTKEPEAVDPNDLLLDNPAHSIKESSAPSEKSAVSHAEPQGIKPRELPKKTSVKEVMSPNPSQGIMGDTAQAAFEVRFKKMENMMLHMQQMFFMQQEEAASASHVQQGQEPVMSEEHPTTPLRGEGQKERSSPSGMPGTPSRVNLSEFPPLPAPPFPPVNGAQECPKNFGPSPAERWKTQPSLLGASNEMPFQGINLDRQEDQASVSWSQSQSQLGEYLENVCKLVDADRLINKDVKLDKLDISDTTTRALRFMLWLRGSRMKIRQLSKVAVNLWDAIIKIVSTSYQVYLDTAQSERDTIHPDVFESSSYSTTKVYILTMITDALSKDIKDYFLLMNVVDVEETLFQLMIRVAPGSHTEVRTLLNFLEKPIQEVEVQGQVKLKFPLTYKAAHTLLEKWEQCKMRVLELKQQLPNPLNAWPALNTIMERVMTIDEEFKLKVMTIRINLDINDNPSYEKVDKMRHMYATFCNQNIDNQKKAHHGPRGWNGDAPKPEPVKPKAKVDPKPIKGLGKNGNNNLNPAACKLNLPGTNIEVDSSSKLVKSHYNGEMNRLNAVYSAGTKGIGKGKDGKQWDPAKSKPCTAFDTKEGCKHGGLCANYHRQPAPQEGKCFRCGSTDHVVSQCTAPKKPYLGKAGGKGDKGKAKDGFKPEAKPKAAKAEIAAAKADASGSDQSGESALKLIQSDTSLAGKMFQSQMLAYFKSNGKDVNDLRMADSNVEAIDEYESPFVSVNGEPLKLPFSTQQLEEAFAQSEVVLGKGEVVERLPCLVDSGCNNPATYRDENLIKRYVPVTLASIRSV